MLIPRRIVLPLLECVIVNKISKREQKFFCLALGKKNHSVKWVNCHFPYLVIHHVFLNSVKNCYKSFLWHYFKIYIIMYDRPCQNNCVWDQSRLRGIIFDVTNFHIISPIKILLAAKVLLHCISESLIYSWDKCFI